MTDMTFNITPVCVDPSTHIVPTISLEEILASDATARLCAFFQRIARLSIELKDERLANIVNDHQIKIVHGDQIVWPPQPPRHVEGAPCA